MNSRIFSIEKLQLQRHEVPCVFRAVLHTIFFNRSFGVVAPKDVDTESFELTYISCNDDGVVKLINDKVLEFTNTLMGPSKRALFSLNFSVKQITSSFFGGTTEKLVPWETWEMEIELLNSSSNNANKMERQMNLSTEVNKRLMFILQKTNDYRDHIPPIATENVVPFHYDIVVSAPADAVAPSGWTNWLPSFTTVKSLAID